MRPLFGHYAEQEEEVSVLPGAAVVLDLMEALRDKFATQSNSVRRAFREVAQPGCSCADEILCVFTSNRS